MEAPELLARHGITPDLLEPRPRAARPAPRSRPRHGHAAAPLLRLRSGVRDRPRRHFRRSRTPLS